MNKQSTQTVAHYSALKRRGEPRKARRGDCSIHGSVGGQSGKATLSNYVTLWKTVETGEKLAVARREEGGVNWGNTGCLGQ